METRKSYHEESLNFLERISISAKTLLDESRTKSVKPEERNEYDFLLEDFKESIETFDLCRDKCRRNPLESNLFLKAEVAIEHLQFCKDMINSYGK